MSFTMEKDGHEIEMSNDRVWGLELLGVKCPYKEQLEVIADWWYGETQRFRKDDSTISFTYERFKELLDLSQFTTNGDNNEV